MLFYYHVLVFIKAYSMHLDMIQTYAKSQLEYPEGVGIKHSLYVKNYLLGNKELKDCTRPELGNLIRALRKEYKLMRGRSEKASRKV